jgi:hypothetical protein
LPSKLKDPKEFHYVLFNWKCWVWKSFVWFKCKCESYTFYLFSKT